MDIFAKRWSTHVGNASIFCPQVDYAPYGEEYSVSQFHHTGIFSGSQNIFMFFTRLRAVV